VLLLLAGAAAAFVLTKLKVPAVVPAGTTVLGVAVGGMDQAHARAALDGPVADVVEAPVRLLVGDESVLIKPARAGVTLDRAATEQAVFAGAPTSRWSQFQDRRQFQDRGTQGHRVVKPVIAVNKAVATKVLTARLAGFTRSARSATMTLPVPGPVLTEKGDATYTAMAAHPVVVRSRNGKKISIPAAVSVLRTAVNAQRTSARVKVTVVRPKVSTAQATRVDQVIGTFTTAHACCAPRVTNIQRIAQLVDGAVIAPGTTFSLNQAAGRRTAENGFVAAPAIADGELVDQFGGGVSQFSTTLFNAAWFSGLPILRHQPHSKYISRYPPGREATLDFDTIDQVIRNDTDTPVVIRTYTTPTAVTVALYGHTGARTVHSFTGPRVTRKSDGFSITVKRVVQQSGSVLKNDTLNWSYTGFD
jgi:vancomycin resistance protein YoaR